MIKKKLVKKLKLEEKEFHARIQKQREKFSERNNK